jgi:site-specific DNA recombinase
MAALGDSYIPEVVELPADDHLAELAEVDEAIADLQADRYDRGLFKGDAGTVRYVAVMGKLEDRADALRAMPVTDARKEIVMSDDLFRDRWATLETDQERGALLRKMGVRLVVSKDATGKARLRLQQGDKHWADVAGSWTDEDVEQFEAEPESA